MYRDHQDIRIIRKCMLDPIRMMRVDVNVGDAPNPVMAQAEDREDRIVQIAEPVGPIRKPVMRSTSGIIDDATIPEEFSRKDRSSCSRRRSAKNFGKYWIGNTAQIMPRKVLGRSYLPPLYSLQSLDIICSMPSR